MDEILEVLINQQEVRYLTYFVTKNKIGNISLIVGSTGIEKKYKFSDENACLAKLVDILLELKSLETWNLKRLEKNK